VICRQPSALGTAAMAGFLALAACGDDTRRRADAGPSDDPDASASDAGPADAAAGLPDLTVNLARAEIDLAVREATFAADACELDPDEDCIDAPGTRRLLHFSVETPNLGDGDMVLGDPDPANPNFQYSSCHGHYHFEGYAEYRLVDPEGGEVAAGRKQAFCLLDTERYVTDDPTVAERPRYGCAYQGIQRGWSDVYQAALPCQFIDVTDVPDGAYTLEIQLNANRTLVEKDYDNNLVSIPVDLASPVLADPTEPCPDGVDDHSSEGTHRECGWTLAAEMIPCVPDSPVNVGCSSAPSCGDAACDGDPMIRVCDGDEEAGNCAFAAALSSSDDTSGSRCPCAQGVTCPDSGMLRVYSAPSRVGQSYECNVEFSN
jgi:Lysyl oxidase